VTTRDKVILGVVAAFVAIAGYWFLLLSPQMKQAKDLDRQVATQRTALQRAQLDAAAARNARTSYAADYATVARLGKAVPVDDDVPSLVYELQSASDATDVDFRAIKLMSTTPGAPSTPPAQGNNGGKGGSSGGSSNGKGTQNSSSGQGKSGSSGSSGGSAPNASGGASGAGGTSGGNGKQQGAPAAPTQAAAAGLPPGAAVGPAGFPTLPFSFTFEGNFFHLSDFFRKLERFIHADPQHLTVNGRLLTVDGIALEAAPDGFPRMTASVAATAYLLPDAEGLLGGATPTGPSQTPVAGGGATTTPNSGGPSTAAATTP
jgi:hypothetical protein